MFHSLHMCFSSNSDSVSISSIGNGVYSVEYASPGEYELQCTATDSDGLSNTASALVTAQQGVSLH